MIRIDFAALIKLVRLEKSNGNNDALFASEYSACPKNLG